MLSDDATCVTYVSVQLTHLRPAAVPVGARVRTTAKSLRTFQSSVVKPLPVMVKMVAEALLHLMTLTPGFTPMMLTLNPLVKVRPDEMMYVYGPRSTLPPPAATAALRHACKAVVSSVAPFPTAPYWCG